MIIVPFDEQHVRYCDHNYSEGWWLNEDIYKWLTTYIGPGCQSGAIAPTDHWGWSFSFFSGKPQNNSIIFYDSSLATLFKLKWG